MPNENQPTQQQPPVAPTQNTAPPAAPVEQYQRPEEPVWEAPTQQTQTGGATASVRDAVAKKLNVDLSDYESDDAFLEEFIDLYKQTPPREQIERYRQLEPTVSEYAQHAAEFQQWREERQRQQQQQDAEKPVQPEGPKWKAPEISDEILAGIRNGAYGKDEHGKLGVFNAVRGKYEYDARHANEIQQADRYLKWHASAAQRIASDPLGVVREAGLDDYFETKLAELEQRFEQRIGGRFQQQQTESVLQSFVNQHSAELFQQRDGVILRDKATGNPLLSPKGQAYADAVELARDHFGITDQLKQHEFALMKSGISGAGGNGNGNGNGAGQPAPQAQDKRQSFLDRVRTKTTTQPQTAPAGQVATAAAVASVAHDEPTEDELWDAAMQEAKNDTP